MKKFLSWLKEHAVQLSFITFVIIFCACLIFVIGCSANKKIPEVEDLPNRFEVLEVFDMGPKTYRVIRDTGTNVLYLVSPFDIEVIVDHEGKPVTWDPYGG